MKNILLQIEQLRKENPEFDVLVKTTQSKLDSFIYKHAPNIERSFRAISTSGYYTPRFFIKAVKLSTKEQEAFFSFFETYYLPNVAGDYFFIIKVPVLPLYYISTYNGVWL